MIKTTKLPLALAITLPLATCVSAAAHAQSIDRLPTSCAALAVLVKAEIDQMRKLRDLATQEEKAPPANLLSAWQRAFGKKGDGIQSLKDLKKRRQRADELNALLQAKGCPQVDIDRALTSDADADAPVRNR